MSACMELKGPPAWYRMKTRPKHLPKSKLDELQHIVEQITARHSVEMIILFGSHSRGDWVEDQYEEGHITYKYRFDFDILGKKGAVTNDDANNSYFLPTLVCVGGPLLRVAWNRNVTH